MPNGTIIIFIRKVLDIQKNISKEEELTQRHKETKEKQFFLPLTYTNRH
jgi:hypothetical protein